jgi:hypothetical protein
LDLVLLDHCGGQLWEILIEGPCQPLHLSYIAGISTCRFGALGKSEVLLCKVGKLNLSLLVNSQIVLFEAFQFDIVEYLFGKFLARANFALVLLTSDVITDVLVFAQSPIGILSSEDSHNVLPLYRPTGLQRPVSPSHLCSPMRSCLLNAPIRTLLG